MGVESEPAATLTTVALKRKVVNPASRLLEWRPCSCSLTRDLRLLVADADEDDEPAASLSIDLETQLKSIEPKRKNRARCELIMTSGQREELMAPSARHCQQFVDAVRGAMKSASRMSSARQGVAMVQAQTEKQASLGVAVAPLPVVDASASASNVSFSPEVLVADLSGSDPSPFAVSGLSSISSCSSSLASRPMPHEVFADRLARAGHVFDASDVDHDLEELRPRRRLSSPASSRFSRPPGLLRAVRDLHLEDTVLRNNNDEDDGRDEQKAELKMLVRVEAALRKLEREKVEAQERERALSQQTQALRDALRVSSAERHHMERELRVALSDKETWHATAQQAQRVAGQLREELAIAKEEGELLARDARRLQMQNSELRAHVHRLDALVYGRF